MPEDRAKAIAFMLEKSLRCAMCGTSKWEWDPKEGGNRFAYEPLEDFCPGCHAKSLLQEDAAKNPGTTVILAPTNTQDHALRITRAEQMWRQDSERKRAERDATGRG